MVEPRRLLRANKGKHLGHDAADVYFNLQEDPEPPLKKRNVDSLDDEYTKLDQQQDEKQSRLDDINATNKSDNEDENVEDDAGEVRCDPCGTNSSNYNEDTDKGGTMIECEACNTWQHARCMGYRTDAAIPKYYQCNRCKPRREAPPRKVERKEVARPSAGNQTRANVTKALATAIAKAAPDMDAAHWASQIENEVYVWAGGTDRKYVDKSRAVMAMAKKVGVLHDLDLSVLTARDVVTRPPEEIDGDLRAVAEKVRQELIRRLVLAEEDLLKQRIRRTHKGEELVGDDELGAMSSEQHRLQETLIASKVVREVRNDTDPENASEPTKSAFVRSLTPPAQFNLYQLGDDEDRKVESDGDDEPVNDTNDASDSDDELDLILKGKEPTPQLHHPPPPPKPEPVVRLPPMMPRRFWEGDIIFPDYVTVAVNAEFAGCTNYVTPKDYSTASFHNKAIRVCKELMVKPKYQIEGRLDRAKADPYLGAVGSSRDLYVVRLVAQDSALAQHAKLKKYLVLRKKVGVLSGRPSFVKDAYIVAVDDEADAPEYLKFANVDLGLFIVYVVKKDYVPVGKSILKKLAPAEKETVPAPVLPSLKLPNSVADLDLILSKLSGSPALIAQVSQPHEIQQHNQQEHYQNSPQIYHNGPQLYPFTPLFIPPRPQVLTQPRQHQQPQQLRSQAPPALLPQAPHHLKPQANQLVSVPNQQPDMLANITRDLTPSQIQYLSEVVTKNPHVQHNPQALLELLQQAQFS